MSSTSFAIPSEVEAFGLVAVEAMRVGIPVVATRVGGLPEVIEDGITGLLVPPADAEALAGRDSKADRESAVSRGHWQLRIDPDGPTLHP